MFVNGTQGVGHLMNDAKKSTYSEFEWFVHCVNDSESAFRMMDVLYPILYLFTFSLFSLLYIWYINMGASSSFRVVFFLMIVDVNSCMFGDVSSFDPPWNNCLSKPVGDWQHRIYWQCLILKAQESHVPAEYQNNRVRFY